MVLGTDQSRLSLRSEQGNLPDTASSLSLPSLPQHPLQGLWACEGSWFGQSTCWEQEVEVEYSRVPPPSPVVQLSLALFSPSLTKLKHKSVLPTAELRET